MLPEDQPQGSHDDLNETPQEITFGALIEQQSAEQPSGEPVTLAEAYRNSLDETFPALTLTPPQAKKIGDFMYRLRIGGGAGVIMTCAGQDCSYRQSCPLYAEKTGPAVQVSDPADPTGKTQMWYQPTKAPVGQPCPIEATLIMDEKVRLSGLVDPAADRTTAERYINELLQLRQLEWRCQMLLAYDEHPVLVDVPAAISPTGAVYYKKEISPLIDVLDRLSKRRSSIMKEAVWSPEALYKKRVALKERDEGSLGKKQSQVRDKIRETEADVRGLQEPPPHVKEEIS